MIAHEIGRFRHLGIRPIQLETAFQDYEDFDYPVDLSKSVLRAMRDILTNSEGYMDFLIKQHPQIEQHTLFCQLTITRKSQWHFIFCYRSPFRSFPWHLRNTHLQHGTHQYNQHTVRSHYDSPTFDLQLQQQLD